MTTFRILFVTIVVAALGAIAWVVSCANEGGNECVTVDCSADCQVSGFERGECIDGACRCVGSSADADADADVPDDARPDVRDDADVREADTREVRDDGREDVSTIEGGEGGEGGCNPFACAMACGGECDAEGNCICPGDDAGDVFPDFVFPEADAEDLVEGGEDDADSSRPEADARDGEDAAAEAEAEAEAVEPEPDAEPEVVADTAAD
jgi:hypothetical protein